MDSQISLIGSIVIGSLFLIGLFDFYGEVSDYSNLRTFELITQETTASFMEIIDLDFREMGSGTQVPTDAIQSITDSTDITFLGDIDGDGDPETIRYYMSDSLAALQTPNVNDKILYRVIDGTNSIDVAAGVTSFSVKLLDEFGQETTNRLETRMIDIEIIVQSTFTYNGETATTRWGRRIAPRSLQYHTRTDT